MRDQLIKILYGGLYDASPGSDRHREQLRRIQAATETIVAREEEIRLSQNPDKRDEKLASFRNKIVKKFHDDPEEAK